MCALCGLLGSTHWTEASAHRGAFTPSEAQTTVRSERQRRARLVSAVLAPLRIRVADWEGTSYRVVSATGRQEVVDDIQAVWGAVERIRGAALDPLDGGYLRDLGAATDQ